VPASLLHGRGAGLLGQEGFDVREVMRGVRQIHGGYEMVLKGRHDSRFDVFHFARLSHGCAALLDV
jgi:hypothetical protein